ncbi:MAG: DUF4145 domain-containing protein [Lentilitoribacter sp.]
MTGYRKGRVGLRSNAIVCPNPDCEELTLSVELTKSVNAGSNDIPHLLVHNSFQLLPQSNAKPQPEYIPQEIRENYTEACLILHQSPKASAAMSRRCLQGMVRDFWKLSKKECGILYNELQTIKDRVPADSWEAIDTIRKVGNIGAHMEKDVNYVVDVEPQEAAMLIELIENLFLDWYIDRHKREERNRRLIALGANKKTQEDDAKAASQKASLSQKAVADKS